MASSLPRHRLLSRAVRVPSEAPRLPPLYSRPTGKGALVGNARRDERDRLLRLAGAPIAPFVLFMLHIDGAKIGVHDAQVVAGL